MKRQKIHYYDESLIVPESLYQAVQIPNPGFVSETLRQRPELVDASHLLIAACRVPGFEGHGGQIPDTDKMEEQRCAVLDQFFKFGADPNIRNNRKVSPLHMSCRFDLSMVAARLLKAGADVDAYDEMRETPLFRATNLGYADCAKVLIEHNADVDFANRKRLTPLHRAVMRGKRQIVPLLLDAGADKNAVDKLGKRPIDYCRNKVIREMLA